MLKPDELRAYLAGEAIEIEGTIVENVAETAGYYVFVRVRRDSNNLQQPTNRKLHGLRDALAAAGTSVEFILKDATASDIEGGLRATVLHRHIDVIRNVFLSVDRQGAHVWIEPKRKLSNDELTDVTARATVYLSELELPLITLKTTLDENLPAKFVCLKLIRQAAPINPDRLMGTLIAADYSIPSRDWLLRRLDTMRRGGLIVRLASGNYVVSLEGLRALGTTKNRRSPDLSRLLALARRNE